MNAPSKLSCRNVWKLYGANAQSFLDKHGAPDGAAIKKAGLIGAVRDANLDIAEGEIFVIMGLSGSGKSTLVRCLSRLIEPTGGEVLFEGIDLLRASDAQMIEFRRHKMGMVFQHFALLPHLTVLQNVIFPLTVQGVARAQALERGYEVVELVGLKGREDNYPRELSGGQQQRVGIARSLVAEPDIWFLDEPFSALDPLIRREMQDEFMRLQARLHKTIVFITHDFDEAVRLADRIGATIDTSLADGNRGSMFALQRVGKVTATLGEISSRSDLVVFWFSDPVSTHPRFLERYARPAGAPPHHDAREARDS